MKSVSAFAALALAFLVPSARSSAQAPATPPGFEFTATGSGTASGDADYAGITNGSIELRSARFSARYRGSFSETLNYHAGAGSTHLTIDSKGGVPLPERLRSVFADVGGSWNFNRDWTVMAAVQPGVYSDTEASSSDGFAAPVMALAQWRGGAWTFGAGVRFNSLARNRTMPIVYARWQPSPDWIVSLGAPRTEVVYKFDPNTSFFAGSSFEGGSFAVDDPAITPPSGYPSLRETKLDYREIRIGVGVRHQFSPALRLQLEGGMAVGRRFEYFDRDLTIEPESAGFLALSFVGTF
jgi:hypothetical protein